MAAICLGLIELTHFCRVTYTCIGNLTIIGSDDIRQGDITMTSKWARWRLKSPASLTMVYSTIYSDADQRKHQSSASLAFVRGIQRGPVNSLHKWPVTRKMFPFHDVIMTSHYLNQCCWNVVNRIPRNKLR